MTANQDVLSCLNSVPPVNRSWHCCADLFIAVTRLFLGCFHPGTDLPCPPKQQNYISCKIGANGKCPTIYLVYVIVPESTRVYSQQNSLGGETQIRLARHQVSALLHIVRQLPVWQLRKPSPLVQLLLHSFGLSAPLQKLSLPMHELLVHALLLPLHSLLLPFHSLLLPDFRKRAGQRFSWDWSFSGAKID